MCSRKKGREQGVSGTQKMSSTVGRINRIWVAKLFGIFFWTNLLLFGLVAHYVGGLEITMYPVPQVALPMAPEEMVFLFAPLWGIQGLILFWQLLFGARKVRRRLMPIYDEMAETAQELSVAAQFDETRFHTLEDAISRISFIQADRLDTGDRDLAGLEEAINDLLERMRESYRQQARFVSDASHELRTPISVIQGYVNMLDRWGKEDEKILQESIAAIQGESKHMQRLVEQLLFLARGDSGKTHLRVESVDLAAMMKEVYDESVMIDSTHCYELKLPENPVTTAGDADMLKQVARILTDNAAKYSPTGEPVILEAGQKPDGTPFFQVQDSGAGMNPEDVPHIFERFYRSDSSRTKSTGGTGLGLAIAKWIIDRHGGHFDVLTWEELGTRITVKLPVRDVVEVGE